MKFCGNCRSYIYGDMFNGIPEDCNHKTGEGHNHTGRYDIRPLKPSESNANNDCEYYSRAWWRLRA